MTNMTMAQHNNSCPRIHEIYNFGRPLLRNRRDTSEPNSNL